MCKRVYATIGTFALNPKPAEAGFVFWGGLQEHFQQRGITTAAISTKWFSHRLFLINAKTKKPVTSQQLAFFN